MATGLFALYIYGLRLLKFVPQAFVTHRVAMCMQVPLVLLVIAPLSVITINRNKVWRTGLEFWGSILKLLPVRHAHIITTG